MDCSRRRSSSTTKTQAEFEQLNALLHAELRPVGELEAQLVDRVATCAWRLRRVLRIETGIFTDKVYRELAIRAKADVDREDRNADLDRMVREYSTRRKVPS